MSLKVAFLNENARAPTRGSVHAAGYDLYAAEEKTIPANGRGLIDLGISMSIPEGTYARIAPRSGLAVKSGLTTGAGVIDYDYRGPVKVMIFNHSTEDFNVTIGDRVAQMILEKIVTPEVSVVEVADLDSTERGAGGFGSTGINDEKKRKLETGEESQNKVAKSD